MLPVTSSIDFYSNFDRDIGFVDFQGQIADNPA